MSTAVQVCSNALVRLGDRPISSFQDLSDRQLAAANLYPQVRDSVLRSHPWNCATKRVVLSPDNTTPAFGWAFEFTLPGDFLRVKSVGEVRRGFNHSDSDYTIESGKILMDSNVCWLSYIFRNDNPQTWDASLDEAMTVAMAAVMALPITGDEGKKQEMERALVQVLRTARTVNGQEKPPENLGDSPLLAVRY